MIVDCHTHWGMVWRERDRQDPSRWLAFLDRNAVTKAVLMGHANLQRPDLCAEDNDTIANLAAQYPERLIPVGTAWPQQGERGFKEARRCLEELGMRGLKFHPWLQGFSTADMFLRRMCALAGEWNVPVFFHDGTPCYCLPEQIGGLARVFPRTTFVLGHAGLLWHWRSAIQAARLPNVWTCLCGPHIRALELLCQRIDPDRLLWGSDFGFGFADQIDYRLNLLLRARIPDGLREQILSVNPLRLLRVEPADVERGG
ncbi:MAG: amidohydrolase [Acidobacteriales bacterium]|nr:amidohydrolase [Terriglobales bacterium]